MPPSLTLQLRWETLTTNPPVFKSAMLTGHRKLSTIEAVWLTRELARTARRLKAFHGLEEIISGMALGADTIWAEIALQEDIPLAAYIPFEVQANTWPEANQKHWRELRAQAQREVVVGPEYSVGYLHARNDAMIKDADICIAAIRLSETRGGTLSAVKKIRARGLPLLILDLDTFTITKENFPL